jgi:hypothetical protein
MRWSLLLFFSIWLLACGTSDPDAPTPEPQDDGGSDPADDAGALDADEQDALPDPADDAGTLDADEQDALPPPDAADAADAADPGDELCTSCGACVESQTVTSVEHVAGGIDYTDLPPFGGSHDRCWTRFGVHEQEVADEHWVHNLEHGAVVFLYHCPDGCEDEVAALERLAGPRPFVLVMPYAELPTRFAAVAWGRRLLSECFDEAAFEEFYDRYFNHAPESWTSPPPSDC